MIGIFQFAVRSQTELEAKLTAVERVSHYYKVNWKWGEFENKNAFLQTIEVESDNGNAENSPAEWPASGRVEFDNAVCVYLLLNNLFKVV